MGIETVCPMCGVINNETDIDIVDMSFKRAGYPVVICTGCAHDLVRWEPWAVKRLPEVKRHFAHNQG